MTVLNEDGEWGADRGAPASGLAKLPAELLYVVADFLHPNDIFRSRSASRYWYHVFAAPTMMKRALVCRITPYLLCAFMSTDCGPSLFLSLSTSHQREQWQRS